MKPYLMHKYIAFSGGVESRTMALLYGKGATAVFTDTGSEHQAMYEKLDEIEAILTEIHEGDFKLIRIKAIVPCGGEIVDSVEAYALKSAFLPGKRERYCTRLFKIAPMDLFLSDKGGCTLMIGLNADEDRDGNFGLLSNVNYTCPLQDDGLTREDCLNLLRANGIEPNFPAYMQRGGCYFCPFKSKKEFKAMVHLVPDEIEKVRILEENVQDKRNKYFRIRDNMPKMRDFIETEKQNLFGDLSEYYDSGEKQYSCGVFCHR
jgi:3'-phosphoadenosine 5'-phosphosulfate sulfotransferase (PAPS reductase)/FAD synthetase